MNSWLEKTLKNEYQFVRMIHRSERTECRQYRHIGSGKSLLLRQFLQPADTDVYDLLKRIRHPNLTEILDVIQTDTYPVILEEFIDGITLAENAGNMNPLGVRRVIIQLCDALSALHSVGIVHRDVTLSNIMLAADGTVKLIDYDIAKCYRTADTANDTLGTVGFAPFEQYGLGNPDERADLFAVGVTANLLLTGKHPSVEMYRKGRLGKMIAVCTQIDPSQRFRSAAEIRELLS